MKKVRQNKKTAWLTIITLVMFGFYGYCAAADIFDLSYILIEGGYRLTLDESNPYKGVKIDINSNIGAQYEVVQRVIMPLQNRDKPRSLIQENFVVRGLIGTNRLGNFRLSTTDTPVKADDTIYVSNSAGNSDSVTLVYGVVRIKDIEPGYYFGRISYTLNPIGSNRAPVTKYLDVYVTVTNQGQVKPRIEIITSSGSRSMILNPRKEDKQSADVIVKIDGVFNKPFSIMQILNQPLESQEGNRLGSESINFIVKEAKKGMAVNKPTALTSGMHNIYTSAPGGEADSSFLITYSLGDLSREKAGIYRTKVLYVLDEMGIQTKLETLELEVENERVFDLTITPGDQKYAIEFRNVKPTEPARKSEVFIEIASNIGKQYQVSQEVYSDLVSKEGDVIPPENFSLRTEGIDTLGKLRFPDKQAAKKGSTVLFMSDNQGSPDKFKIIYELECPKGIKAGDYSTRIVYSLLEI